MKDKLIKVKITEAKYLRDYIIQFTFSDGNIQKVNFEKWIRLNAGGCAKYLDKKLFKKFEIVNVKDITWNDEMDFPFIFLYEEHKD